MRSLSKNFLSDAAVGWVSFVSFAIGLANMVAWKMDYMPLVQSFGDHVPMQFNTALWSFLTGTAGLLAASRRFAEAYVCLIPVAVLSGLTLWQYGLDVSLGIDQLLHTHQNSFLTESPGRPAPNTALVALLGALIGYYAHYFQMALFFSCLVLALAIAGIAGYVADMPGLYRWGEATAMAPTTCVYALCVAITGFMAIQRRRRGLAKWRV